MTAGRPVRAETAPGEIEAAFSFALLCGRDAPNAARHAAAGETRDWAGSDSTEFELALLLSELVTNAISHGSVSRNAAVNVEGTLIGTCLGMQVTNAGPPFAHVADLPPASQPGGRGLALVDALADRWGAFHEDGYTTVWFELDVGAPAASARATSSSA